MNIQRLQNLYDAVNPDINDIVYFLASKNKDEINELYLFADKIRSQFMGDGILLRGIVEFSNFCRNKCFYCGLQVNNKKLQRYRLTKEELLKSIDHIASSKIQTVVLQSGEEDDLQPQLLADIIQEIKKRYDMSVTLSIGERSKEEYKLWKDAGADRYLLKIETSDKNLYEYMHPGMSFDNRVQCLDNLKELGYQVGSGIIIGLKNQTLEIIAKDILFFKAKNFDMIGIGPFIAHADTEFRSEHSGSVELTLKTLALTRIITRNAHLPATTSLGSLNNEDYRLEGLKAGANVLMPNFTPYPYKKFYEIYPGKRCINEPAGNCAFCMDGMAKTINRWIDYSKGDSLKFKSIN